jgi:anti-anti-sigma regulatory factor
VRANPPTRQLLQSAAIDETESWRERVIRPRGAWVEQNLQSLRESFTRNALKPKSLRLDLSGVTHADTSFLGQLVLLYGVRNRLGLKLSCAPVSRQAEKLMRYGCGEYLLQPSSGSHG